jgi:GTPase SAR1 family protein
MPKQTLLVYGRSNSGKTAQVGRLAEHVYKKTKKFTRLATSDKGGLDTIRPYVDLGIIQPIELGESDPWIWLNQVVRGNVRDAAGKWIPGKNDDIGLFAFESLRSIAEAMMSSMARKAGEGISIGGGSNISFSVQGDGQQLKIAGGNMAHFGVAQQRVTDEVWESQKLNAEYILWTSSVSKDEDATASGKVLGPDVIGKALTAEVPRWFQRTFRMDVFPAQGGKPERHVLYLGSHVDVGAGNAAGLGNLRLPLDATPLTQTTIEPADLVRALELLEAGKGQATEQIKKRLGL